MSQANDKDVAAALRASFYKRRDNWIDHVLTVNDLSPMARVLGIWIARRINHRKGCAWYKVETMAKKFDVWPRTITRTIQELEGYRTNKKTNKKERTGPQLLLVRRDQPRGRKTSINRYEFIPIDNE